ncbi:hypothetical protein COOONC_13377 [Cooperia oncophora]
MVKKAPKISLVKDTKQPPFLQAIKKDRPDTDPKRQAEKPEKDAAQSQLSTPKSEHRPTENKPGGFLSAEKEGCLQESLAEGSF